MVMINRTVGFPSSVESSTHPIDTLAGSLSRFLEVVGNHPTFVATTDEVRFDEDLPTEIYAVVTNDQRYAEWCRSWRGNLIELGVVDGDLLVSARGQSRTFKAGEIQLANEWIQDEVEHQGDDGAAIEIRPLGAGVGLDQLDHLRIARDGIEQMLAELGVLLSRDDLDAQAGETATVLSENLLSYYRMEMPPPVEAVDGVMIAAARLIHEHADLGETPGSELDKPSMNFLGRD